MLCARLKGGPCDGLDYHFMAADQPPETFVMGRPTDSAPWMRLVGSLVADPDLSPQTYRLADPMPAAIDDDGEPVYEYAHAEIPARA